MEEKFTRREKYQTKMRPVAKSKLLKNYFKKRENENYVTEQI